MVIISDKLVQDYVSGANFMWLEITGKCQLQCEHCYAESGPSGTHGNMQAEDWIRVIDDAADAGVMFVQFIGGEPTLHPALPSLIRQANSRGLKVEIFSNLVYVTAALWEVFKLPNVSLATSYYSTRDDVHDQITGRNLSHRKTKDNIGRAVSSGIELRVGIIDVNDAQDTEAARAELLGLGVSDNRIGLDYSRGVGRGGSQPTDPIDEFCGNCSGGVLAVLPDGNTHPCVFSRQPEFLLGNVLDGGLSTILDGPALRETRALMQKSFDARRSGADDAVNAPQPDCWPYCAPNCSPSCSPSCVPMGNCRPVVGPPY